MAVTYEEISAQAEQAALELTEAAKLKSGDILIVGCSSSEVVGEHIGKASDIYAAQAIYDGIQRVLRPRGIFLAAQCCEHLNRAVVVERTALLPGTQVVNAVPQPKAGGSFATVVYDNAWAPAVVESLLCDAGMDIGRTLIGMHLKPVAVPVRTSVDMIGEAILVTARTRAKFIGGSRAIYDDALAGGEVHRATRVRVAKRLE